MCIFLCIYLNIHSVSKLNDTMTGETRAWHVTEKPVLNGIKFLASSEISFFRCGRADVDVPDTVDADVICLSLAPNLALPGDCHQCKLQQPVLFFSPPSFSFFPPSHAPCKPKQSLVATF